MPNSPEPKDTDIDIEGIVLDEREFLEKRRSGYRLRENTNEPWPVNRVQWQALENQRQADPPPAPLRPAAIKQAEPNVSRPMRWVNEISFVVVAASIGAIIAAIVMTMIRY